MTVTLTSKAKSHLIFCFMHQKYLKRSFNYTQIRYFTSQRLPLRGFRKNNNSKFFLLKLTESDTGERWNSTHQSFKDLIWHKILLLAKLRVYIPDLCMCFKWSKLLAKLFQNTHQRTPINWWLISQKKIKTAVSQGLTFGPSTYSFSLQNAAFAAMMMGIVSVYATKKSHIRGVLWTKSNI